MKEELKKLFDEENKIKDDIKSALQAEAKALVQQLSEDKLSESELRTKLSDLIRGTEDIIPVYRLLVEEAKKQGVALTEIKKGLAKRLAEKAKEDFMSIEASELNEARQLFEEIGMETEAEKCKKLAENMFAISEDNESKVEIL